MCIIRCVCVLCNCCWRENSYTRFKTSYQTSYPPAVSLATTGGRGARKPLQSGTNTGPVAKVYSVPAISLGFFSVINVSGKPDAAL